jgi:hypothetical protein
MSIKLDKLETHDRLQIFAKQSDEITKGMYDCIRLRPQQFEEHPFYIFAHKRDLGMDERISIYNTDLKNSILSQYYLRKYTHFDQVPTTRVIWCPRLTKPKMQTNSMLFKAYPGKDYTKIIWILPAPELWGEYEIGKLVEHQTVLESIYNFKDNRKAIEAKEDDDLPDEKIDAIYKEIALAKSMPKYEMI